jgi:hypothetical protein
MPKTHACHVVNFAPQRGQNDALLAIWFPHLQTLMVPLVCAFMVSSRSPRVT